MERKKLMKAVADRALAQRVPLSRVCSEAGISTTVAYRWLNEGKPPQLPTIGKLERRLDAMERAA